LPEKGDIQSFVRKRQLDCRYYLFIDNFNQLIARLKMHSITSQRR